MTTPASKKTTRKPAQKKEEKKKEGFQAKIETYNDLYFFREGLLNVSRTGAKFTYAVSKNLRMVNAEMQL